MPSDHLHTATSKQLARDAVNRAFAKVSAAYDLLKEAMTELGDAGAYAENADSEHERVSQ